MGLNPLFQGGTMWPEGSEYKKNLRNQEMIY